MSNEKINHYNSSSNSSVKDNTELIYNYTEYVLAERNKSIDNLNSKLSTFLAFAGALLKFSLDLPGKYPFNKIVLFPCYTCIYLKIFICLLLALSIVSCGLGLLSNPVGETVSPQRLKTKYGQKPVQEGKFFIINTRIEKTIPQLEEASKAKRKNLNRAIKSLCLAAVLFAVDIVITTYFYE